MKSHTLKTAVELHKKAEQLEKVWSHYESNNGKDDCTARPELCFRMKTEKGTTEVCIPHLDTHPELYCSIMECIFEELRYVEKKIESL